MRRLPSFIYLLLNEKLPVEQIEEMIRYCENTFDADNEVSPVEDHLGSIAEIMAARLHEPLEDDTKERELTKVKGFHSDLFVENQTLVKAIEALNIDDPFFGTRYSHVTPGTYCEYCSATEHPLIHTNDCPVIKIRKLLEAK